MTRILDIHKTKIKGSKTTLSFETTGDSHFKIWDRFIAIGGEPAYQIGNICETCIFFFERLEGANQTINPKQEIEQLNEGLDSIDSETLDTIREIIPDGKYFVMLLEIQPRLVDLSTEDDYFTSDQKDLWEEVRMCEKPHQPKVRYYRGNDQNIGEERKIFEFINPLLPPKNLQKDRVDFYSKKLNEGKKPTALAISVLDIKQPADWLDDIIITEHWCLAHYLLDGHHKLFAASETNQTMTLLTFLALDKGISSKSNIKELIEKLRNTVPNKG